MAEDSEHMNASSEEPNSILEQSSPNVPWDKIERRSGLKSAWQAVSYVSNLNRDGLRRSDIWTERLLVACLILVSMLLFTPFKYVPVMIVSCDVLFGVTLVVFLGNRLGSLTLLSAKQAILVLDLLMSASLLAIFLVVQLVAVFLLTRNYFGFWLG